MGKRHRVELEEESRELHPHLVQVPEVIRDDNLFKTSQKRLLNIYTLDRMPYVQFLMEQ